MRTVYEWDVEELDRHGDIVDHHFCENYKQLLKCASDFQKCDIVLVRDVESDSGGVEDRLWAYMKDGKLPEYFADSRNLPTGIRVPKKFHLEVSRAERGVK